MGMQGGGATLADRLSTSSRLAGACASSAREDLASATTVDPSSARKGSGDVPFRTALPLLHAFRTHLFNSITESSSETRVIGRYLTREIEQLQSTVHRIGAFLDEDVVDALRH